MARQVRITVKISKMAHWRHPRGLFPHRTVFRFWPIVATAINLIATADAATIFTILLKPDGSGASPSEYFEDMQQFFANPNPPSDPNSLLAKVDKTYEPVMTELIECDLDPFWEKGAIVTDEKYCPYSTMKLVVWSLVPAVCMLFGLLGLWSRQRNTQGRGKETQIGSLISIGLVLLSVSYDWLFSWTLFRSPKGNLQTSFSELALAHLIGCVALNFAFVHFWFRRKFLVGMPWYEFHKHGLGLHMLFLLMYVQPQAVNVFQSRLFNIDLFNIHFGTPSKMNEVLSHVGCMSLLNDIPQFCIQFVVWVTDETNEAPKVTRISLALITMSISFTLKRQYIASVERQWYKEIVRMAGVRRLTTYGGASRWLKVQKRPSAAADAKAHASTSQQQLFLAWMQSMGRRQESISADAAGTDRALADGDARSEDSEDDLDTLSESSDGDEDGEGDEKEGSGGSASGESGGGDDGASGSGSGSGSGSASGSEKSFEEQSFRRKGGKQRQGKRRRDDDSPIMGSRRRAPGASGSGVSGGLLGFARNVVDNMSESGIVSESDIFAFARNVAARGSDSGVVTESYEEERSGDTDANSLMKFARGAADERSSAVGSATSGMDLLAFARHVAQGPSESGVTSAAESDIFAFARRNARQVSDSGAGAESDIFQYSRRVADNTMPSDVTTDSQSRGGSDILAAARAAAEEVSVISGSRAETDIFEAAFRAAEQVSRSGVGSDVTSDLFAAARNAARDVSRSGIGSDVSRHRRAGREGDDSSDVFALARRAAEQSDAGSSAIESDIFAAARRAAQDVSRDGASSIGTGGPRPAAGRMQRRAGSRPASDAETDIFAAAQRAADEISEAPSHSMVGSDIYAAARRAAQDVSVSGVGPASASGVSELFGTGRRAPDIFGAAQEAALDASVSGVSAESDIFAVARKAAADVSHSGVGSGATSKHSRRGGLSGRAPSTDAESDIFTAARRAAVDASVSGVGSDAPSAAGSDIFAAARRAAVDASVSGVGSGVPSAASGDVFGAARRAAAAAADASESGVGSDIFAFARRAAGDASVSGVGSVAPSVAGSDIFAVARRAAGDASVSGVGSAAPSAAGSDIFAVARRAAGDASVSGVGSAAPSAAGSDIFAAAKRAAGDASVSGVGSAAPSAGGSDIFAAARRAAADASLSGVGSAATSAAVRSTATGFSDIFAQGPRNSANRSARGNAEARRPPESEPSVVASSAVSSASNFDLVAEAQGAADEASRSGVHTASLAGSHHSAHARMGDLFSNLRGSQLPPPPPQPQPRRQPPQEGPPSRIAAKHQPFAPPARALRSAAEDTSEVGSEFDILGNARAAAAEVSRSDVDSRSGVGSDIFAIARAAAADVESRSGIAVSTSGADSDIFGAVRRVAADAASGVGSDIFGDVRAVAADAASGVGSDIFGDVRAVAADAASGVGSDIFGDVRAVAADAASGVESDIYGDLRDVAADAASQSGVGSDIFGAARRAAADVSGVGTESMAGGSEISDIFGAARQAAADLSHSGVGSRSGVSGNAGGMFSAQRRGRGGGRGGAAGGRGRGDLEFAPPSRHFAAEGRHRAALSLQPSMHPPASAGFAPEGNSDEPPWAAIVLPSLAPPPPAPSQRRPPSPPGAAPPMLDTVPKPEPSPTPLPPGAAPPMLDTVPKPQPAPTAEAVVQQSVCADSIADEVFLSSQGYGQMSSHGQGEAEDEQTDATPVLQFARQVAAAAAPAACSPISRPSAHITTAGQRDGSDDGLFFYRRPSITDREEPLTSDVGNRGSDTRADNDSSVVASAAAVTPTTLVAPRVHSVAGSPPVNESARPRPPEGQPPTPGSFRYHEQRRASSVADFTKGVQPPPPSLPPPPSSRLAASAGGGDVRPADEVQRQLRLEDLRRRRSRPQEGDRDYKRKHSRNHGEGT